MQTRLHEAPGMHPSREFACVAHPEKTQSGFYKYDVVLPLDRSKNLPLRSVTLTIWSKDKQEPFKDKNTLSTLLQDESNLPVMLCSGLAANSTQYDRTGNSFIKALDDKLTQYEDPDKQKNSIFIAMSCPGFSGSDDMYTGKKVTRDMVSVDTYSHLIETVSEELKIKNKSILAGHSAGGAAVLDLLSRNKTDAHTAYIALHPAIHKKRALQFDLMRTLENLKPVLLDNSLKRAATQLVIRYYLGLPILEQYPEKDQKKVAEFIMKLLKGAELVNALQKLDPATLEQVYLHVDEFMQHPEAGKAKLDDLRRKRVHGENTAMATTLVITGNKDRITRDNDINDEFNDVIEQMATKKVMNTHHDDMFFNAEAQQEATDIIARNALFDLNLANQEITHQIKAERRQAEMRRREMVTRKLS